MTGSSGEPKMIGIVVVAALAASVATMLPGVAITATCRRTRSAINADRASSRPSSQWYSIVTFWPYEHKLVLDRIKRLLAARAQQGGR